jgi:hypothetical protein
MAESKEEKMVNSGQFSNNRHGASDPEIVLSLSEASPIFPQPQEMHW